MKIALLIPHVFMNSSLLKRVIFSPGTIALDLAEELFKMGNDVTIFSPGKIKTPTGVKNIYGDFSLIEKELKSRNYDINTLIKKHPLTYITLSRQIQAELIADCFNRANNNEFDIVHVWINEEDIALNFAQFCQKPIVFTHHEPFNFLTKYRTSFEKYKKLNWVSISYSQRKTIKSKMNWVDNVYHGVKDIKTNLLLKNPKYFAYLGRIIENKGVHLAIKAVKKLNKERIKKSLPIIPLKIAGKYYSSSKNTYWNKKIKPFIDNKEIIFAGFISNEKEKHEILFNAYSLLVPSIWDEPFGLICIESLRAGTPIIGLNNGALPEIITKKTGRIAKTFYKLNNKGNKEIDQNRTIQALALEMSNILSITKNDCREVFLENFTSTKMAESYLIVYNSTILN